MQIHEFQELIERIYLQKDQARGVPGTFMWLVEELGELARHLRDGDRPALEAEFADVLAWLVTLASITGVDLESTAVAKYGAGCPKCGATPCACQERRGG
jgi:NTP pyrophosphatase (non-canonical NTP hydrolase)